VAVGDDADPSRHGMGFSSGIRRPPRHARCRAGRASR
jgi:hypothetical protein